MGALKKTTIKMAMTAATIAIIQTLVLILAPLLSALVAGPSGPAVQFFTNESRFSGWATYNSINTTMTQFHIIRHRPVKTCSTIRNSSSFKKPATLAPIGGTSSPVHVFYAIYSYYHTFSPSALQILAGSGLSYHDTRLALIG